MLFAIDVMGGESPPTALFSGALEAAKQLNGSVHLNIYCSYEVQKDLRDLLDTSGNSSIQSSITFVPCREVVYSEDNPLTVLRNKSDASMFQAIEDLADSKVDCYIGVGSTGALVAKSSLSIPTLSFAKRPALMTELPSTKGKVYFLDVGAFVEPSPQQLLENALLASAWFETQTMNVPQRKAKVGLLNIGTENYKGNQLACQTYDLLQSRSAEVNCPFEFMGNIEGESVFSGIVDVVVTDGFTGNIFLKACEGLFQFLLSKEVMKDMDNEGSFALLCGLKKAVFKCHGNSDGQVLYSSILKSYALLSNDIFSRFIQTVQKYCK